MTMRRGRASIRAGCAPHAVRPPPSTWACCSSSPRSPRPSRAAAWAATLVSSTARLVDCIAGGGCDNGGGSPAAGPVTATPPGTLEARLERLAEFAGGAGPLGAPAPDGGGTLARGDRAAAEESLGQLEFYAGLIAAGPRGACSPTSTARRRRRSPRSSTRATSPSTAARPSRRFFDVEPQPGRGVVAFDFFIPSENSDGFRGDGRPEAGTDILRSRPRAHRLARDDRDRLRDRPRRDRPVRDPHGRPVGRRRRQRAAADLAQRRPRRVGQHGRHRHRPDAADRLRVRRGRGAPRLGHPQLDLAARRQRRRRRRLRRGLRRLPDLRRLRQPGPRRPLPADPGLAVPARRRSREIARNDYQGGHNPVQGALPHCDLPNGPDLPTIGIGGHHVWDMPDLPDGPSVPGPC